MTLVSSEFQDHLDSGSTTLCRCWLLRRRDGESFGFTDHDVTLHMDGNTFRPDAGMSARALEQSTGLSIDNSEAIGVLNSESIRERDIFAGRFDGAEVTIWIVNWQDTSQRLILFKGGIGQIERGGGAFRAELCGLAEKLNNPVGRIYQKPCPAVLGDKSCKFDLNKDGYRALSAIEEMEDRRVFRFSGLTHFEPRWFEKGRFEVLDGAGKGLIGQIKNDRIEGDLRSVELWENIPEEINVGDNVLIQSGCNKTVQSCRLKFANIVNYQGFPYLPGNDWIISAPKAGAQNDGASLF